MMRCTHCLIEFPERDAVRLPEDPSKVFCCHGCRGIWELIHSEGLERFYRERNWQSAGIPEGIASPDIDLTEFESLVSAEGEANKIELFIDGIRCASCVWLNEKILQRLSGILSVRINFGTHKAVIKWNPQVCSLKDILKTIHSIGYRPKPYSESASVQALKAEQKDLLVRFSASAFLSSQLMIYTTALYAGYFQGIDEQLKLVFEVIAMILTLPVLFYSGAMFFRSFVLGLRQLHFGMDSLIAIGASSAFVYSVYAMFTGGKVYFDTSAMIITLILLGRYIEAIAKGKASETVQKLAEMLPKEAWLISDSKQLTKVPVKSLKPQDLIVIKPGDKVPVDGIVVEGQSEVDEQIISGESKPVHKSAGAKVIAGTINLFGSLTVSVDKTMQDTMIGAIIKAVKEALDRKAQIQAYADKVVSVFVPVIIVLAILTCIGHIAFGKPLQSAVMTAVSVLVIACPCSLGLATPIAILLYNISASSLGILVQNPDTAEKTASVDYVVFDKTGTITSGKQTVIHIEVINSAISKNTLLQYASSLEARAEHSIAQAILKAYDGQLLDVQGFEAVAGKGIRGVVSEKLVVIGNRAFMSECDVNIDEQSSADASKHEGSAHTVVFVAIDNVLAGFFVIADSIRPEAVTAINMLKAMHLQVALLSGDNLSVCKHIAKQAGIEEVLAGQTPLMKAHFIKTLKQQGHRPMMVGDGINDALSLTEAYVGVAMGKGTDIAMQSADASLLREDLRSLPKFITLSKKAKGIIRGNIFWAFAYNTLSIPVAMAGLLHPIIAAIAMALSSLFVVLNSLRIKKSPL